MRDFWSFLLQTLTASGVAALLLVLKAMFRDKLSPRWQFGSWSLLAFVLLLPAGRGGRYTLFNWPFYVETLRSLLTGDYNALARVTAPVPLPPQAPPRTAAEWLFVIYALGVVLLLGWYTVSYVRLRLALKRGRPADRPQVRAVAERYGLPVCPHLEVEGLSSAFICGVFRPVLVLPAGAETDDKVILHELLHLKYHDALWGLLICLFRCLHWCNPLLWYCAGRAGNDLESLCDQRVLERLEGEDRRDYGRILLSMAGGRYAHAPGTSSMANGSRNIRRRIEAIARFKRYPAGMGLVSVCLLLVLAAPLAAGTSAPVSNRGLAGFAAADFAYARTLPCTTCAGAFDTYAMAVIRQRADYRAMCAPLSEQSGLAAGYLTAPVWTWEEMGILNHTVDRFAGYQILNLRWVGDHVCEGMLAVTLGQSPEGEAWDGTTHTRWMAVQPLRAEQEGDRWVVIPQGGFTVMQGDLRKGGNIGLPAWEYTARAGDFTIRVRWQTTSQVDSSESVDTWYGSRTAVHAVPVPDGEFATWFDQIVLADYHGAPGDRDQYRSIGVSSLPMWGPGERPDPDPLMPPKEAPDAEEWSGSSSTGAVLAQRLLNFDWSGDDPIFLAGGGSIRDGFLDPPAACAADFYLNGEKAAELTLALTKGGNDPD